MYCHINRVRVLDVVSHNQKGESSEELCCSSVHICCQCNDPTILHLHDANPRKLIRKVSREREYWTGINNLSIRFDYGCSTLHFITYWPWLQNEEIWF